MIGTTQDRRGVTYTVLPCFVDRRSRIYYCGSYMSDKDTWRRLTELTPKKLPEVAYEDLLDYIEALDRGEME